MADAKQEPKREGKVAAPRISDVFLRESAQSGDGYTSASLGLKDVVSIIPGCIDSGGKVATSSDSGERPSDGLLVTVRKRLDGKTVLVSDLIPWANVRNVTFEAVELEAVKAA